jgi:hypothetical protein
MGWIGSDSVSDRSGRVWLQINQVGLGLIKKYWIMSQVRVDLIRVGPILDGIFLVFFGFLLISGWIKSGFNFLGLGRVEF